MGGTTLLGPAHILVSQAGPSLAIESDAQITAPPSLYNIKNLPDGAYETTAVACPNKYCVVGSLNQP